ncbi:nitric oxide reductase activation protein NorD [Flavihumibacter solisilvae]|uniref:NorD protein n=1 Tax=Flavihumibacter solisilvae TaxID=1349421 RepID=A0A0C1LFX3_9BACT|nr:VWA domain-containing protein [Flavihumibacter solisilvae]KIC94253.1 NorD protein [Flavihumibacter solisilvae]
MALDEFLYGKIANYFKKRKTIPDEIISRMVSLADIKPRLTILARAVTGSAIELYPAEREGGYKQNNFFLPPAFSLFPSYQQNLSFYFFRILYLSVQRKLHFNWYAADEQPDITSQRRAKETSAQVLENLFEEYPVTKQLHDDFIAQLQQCQTEKSPVDYSWLYGKWMRDGTENNADELLRHFSDKTKTANENKITTVLKAKAVEAITSIQVDKKQQEDYVLTHNFEKVDTADEFSGVWRDFDGEDELEKQADALDELNMKFTVRVDDTAHSVYQADFTENTTIAESADASGTGQSVCYDEWNYAKRTYKEKFCKVYPARQLKEDAGYYKQTISKNSSLLTGLRKMLTNVNNKLQQQRRLRQGEEIDADAITDLFADIHSGHSPSENIYLSKRKKEKDLSILLLLDISLSSDGYADGNRVIDVEKQASLLFGEILNEFNIDFAIAGFYSKTRNHCSYLMMKDFEENWQKARYRIGAAEPNGYTRIGAALRHSGALLDQRNSKNKWVILISDGKPNDYDRYEGRYGIQDVKQALRELNQRQIQSYALAIEAQARYYLPQMFGQNHYQILSNLNDLLQSLVKLYERIKHQS